ncbi:hypothetical protein D3C86_1099680 [compost metagenome]
MFGGGGCRPLGLTMTGPLSPGGGAVLCPGAFAQPAIAATESDKAQSAFIRAMLMTHTFLSGSRASSTPAPRRRWR